MWGVIASPSHTLCLGSDTLCKIGTLLVTFGWQCCMSATERGERCRFAIAAILAVAKRADRASGE